MSITKHPGRLGVDISSLQGEIDFAKLAAWRSPDGRRIEFVIARACNGTVRDSRHREYRQAAKANGLLFGSYGVLYPAGDAVAQADTFLDVVGVVEPDELPPMLDLEVEDGIPGGDGEHRAGLAWVERVEDVTGRRCLVYTGWGFWKAIDDRAESPLADRPLVVAHYTDGDKPLMPRAWHAWTIHQYSGNGGERVAGCLVDIDRDVAHPSVGLLEIIAASKLHEAHPRPWMPSVHELQARLGVDADGVWGPKSNAALRAYQTAQGLPPTGIVGPRTIALLFPEHVAPTEPPPTLPSLEPPRAPAETAPLTEAERDARELEGVP